MPDPVREFLTELTREPYADSDPASLLSWVRGRAAAVLAEMDKREPADLRRVREALEAIRSQFGRKQMCAPKSHETTTVAALVDPALASLDAVAQRLADLEARVRDAEERAVRAGWDLDTQIAETLRLSEGRAELEADKARLDWILRAMGYDWTDHVVCIERWWNTSVRYDHKRLTPEEARAEIDAAREGK